MEIISQGVTVEGVFSHDEIQFGTLTDKQGNVFTTVTSDFKNKIDGGLFIKGRLSGNVKV